MLRRPSALHGFLIGKGCPCCNWPTARQAFGRFALQGWHWSGLFHYQPDYFIGAEYLDLRSNTHLSVGRQLVLILARVLNMKFLLENRGRWRIEGAVHFNLFPRVFHRRTVLQEDVHGLNPDIRARRAGVGEDEITADGGWFDT